MSQLRLAAAAFALLMLAGALPLPQVDEASAQAPPPASSPAPRQRCDPVPVRHLMCVQAVHREPEMAGLVGNLYRVAWRPVPNPNGQYEALVVGGMGKAVGVPQRSVILAYDGLYASRVVDVEGPQFIDVAWAPDGSYALAVTDDKPIYRIDPPAPGKPQYTLRNLWGGCGTSQVSIEGCAEAYFRGSAVSFNPTQGYAWITGSSLLQYDGRELSVIEGGADIAYRAIGWDPQGKTALLSALVCVNPENIAVDAPCPQNITAGQIVPGRVLLADTATQRMCEVYTYGKYNPQRAEVNDVSWHPSGSYALLYGDDDFHGTILRYDPSVPRTGTTENGCPKLADSFTYLAPDKSEGEFNSMAYNPRTDRFMAAAGAGKELWEGNGTAGFTDVLGEHDLTSGKGTIYYGIGWHPVHDYFLVSGFDMRLYKFVPANAPFLRLASPKNATLVTGEALVAGKAYSPGPFQVADRVEVNITGPSGSTGWMAANITSRHITMLNWTLPWNTDLVQADQFYLLQARAWLGDMPSNTANRTVRVVRSGGLEAPVFEATDPTDPDGDYILRWSAGTTRPGVVYDLEESGLPAAFAPGGQGQVVFTQDFAFAGDERLVYNGTERQHLVLDKKDGQYVYRVRARTADAVSPWSQPLSVAVAIDTDGDGWPDAQEIAAGASIHQPGSTPEDPDADGCKGRDDAFPLDPRECRDTDGDGTGDNADQYPLDHRETADSDGDGWGDHAERRLASDPFDAASTPESDDDGDGCINQDEAQAKTGARDPTSAPSFCARARAGGSAGTQATPGLPALAALGALGLAARALRRRRA